jgi:hypothetical protein
MLILMTRFPKIYNETNKLWSHSFVEFYNMAPKSAVIQNEALEDGQKERRRRG